MKIVRKFFDNLKPKVAKGSKFYWLHSTVEAFDSFAFVPKTTAKSGAHLRDAIDMKRAMSVVIVAVIPALLFGMYNVGYEHYLSHGQSMAEVGFWQTFWYGFLKVLPLIVVSYVVGLGIEFAFAQKRGHEVNEGYLVTGMLIPLICPPDVPLWQLALAVAFAVIIGKEIFGGTGMNFLNPALVARAFLFFSYPSQMSGDTVWIADKADAISGATALGEMMTGGVQPHYSILDMFLGFIPGCVGETSVVAILIGAAILLVTGIASWRIMLSVFVGGAAMGLTFNLLGSSTNAYMQLPFYYHFLMGGFMFGAVFMATDPVTSSQTNKGKYIYGLLIGIMAVLIRVVNPAYPEGMMLAILLLNVFAPLIDYFVVDSNIKKRAKRWKLVDGGHKDIN
ncbi:MAG: NADH:ubiquinone reductase (Na(+)-transporting) subunit B [Bacteroidales bacterium]|jgi:Na+-transporting NADH:ubiquinone oxidoreductase subunit B|nr:NADH:ubiquinone reductase (Na(+)-transporting) subunit B [Bacteroidales bacterium]